MRLIELPTVWTVLVDMLAWLVIHLAIALWYARMPKARFQPEAWPFRIRSWEASGRLYAQLLAIRTWKKRLPDAASASNRFGFPKKFLESQDSRYLETFVLETCRAELMHWSLIPCALPFFLWNKPAVGVIMVVYIVLENLPIIVTQRYNRARLQTLLNRRRRRGRA